MQGNYILSFLGAAPMNDPKAVVYLAIDNPKNTIQYGGVVTVAPISKVLYVVIYVCFYLFHKLTFFNF